MEIDCINKHKNIKLNIENIVSFTEMSLRVLKLPDELSVCMIFTDDAEIKELNRKYFNKDTETDVISFPQFSDWENRMNDTMGDIVISLDTAGRNSKIYNKTPEIEIELLIIHGILHLLNYDHPDEKYFESEMAVKAEDILKETGGNLNYYE